MHNSTQHAVTRNAIVGWSAPRAVKCQAVKYPNLDNQNLTTAMYTAKPFPPTKTLQKKWMSSPQHSCTLRPRHSPKVVHLKSQDCAAHWVPLTTHTGSSSAQTALSQNFKEAAASASEPLYSSAHASPPQSQCKVWNWKCFAFWDFEILESRNLGVLDFGNLASWNLGI